MYIKQFLLGALHYALFICVGIPIGVAICGFKEWFPQNPPAYLAISTALLSMATARYAIIVREQEYDDE